MKAGGAFACTLEGGEMAVGIKIKERIPAGKKLGGGVVSRVYSGLSGAAAKMAQTKGAKISEFNSRKGSGKGMKITVGSRSMWVYIN